ncbi:MAG TPA: RodZ domain-containing protein [Candidatus Limnocylindrales bacterium]|nr:RodZ domain-containing protein [Candidatus Limnocylindrales bacterium]
MTARHQLRIGNRRLGRDRTPIDATPAPPVGETLQIARERKGVDLFRAERDTKIRLRYLAALEDGAYDDLPAPVYTKGFLRNYAIYLGLEPEEILERWRDEMESLRESEQIAVAPPPQPIAAPARSFHVSSAIFFRGLVAVVIVAFVGYLAIQLLRFAETTPVALTNPPNVVSTVNDDHVALEGTAGRGSLITIRGPGGDLWNPRADEDGHWAQEVPLSLGRNDFTVIATDAVTNRESKPLLLTINVPLPSRSPNASPSVPPPVALVLALDDPEDGFLSSDGIVVVRGTTTGSRITITSTYLGEPLVTAPQTLAPGATPTLAPTPAGEPTPSPTPSPMPGPSEVPPSSAGPSSTPSIAPSLAPGATGPSRDITVSDAGTFDETMNFGVGRWELTVTTNGIGVDPLVETRTITVGPPPTTGIVLAVSVEGRRSWVRLQADGARIGGFGTLEIGFQRTVTATSEICLYTGNAGGLHLTLNGLDLGLLGRAGQVGSWLIRAGEAPTPTESSCG